MVAKKTLKMPLSLPERLLEIILVIDPLGIDPPWNVPGICITLTKELVYSVDAVGHSLWKFHILKLPYLDKG